MNFRLVSLFALLVLILTVFYLFFTQSMWGRGPVAIAVQVCAAFLMLWARVTFGRQSLHAGANPTAGGLVTSGPYRYWRHPIYVSILVFTWTGIIANWKPMNALVGVLIVAAVFVRMYCEERLLIIQYPEYAEYSQKAKRLIPFVY